MLNLNKGTVTLPQVANCYLIFGPYEDPHSMLKNKMAKAKLGLEIYTLTTIPERADVGDGSGGERGTSETPPELFQLTP